MNMKKVLLKSILIKYYSKHSIASLLCGRRTPSYSQALMLENLHGIPLTAWKDIKSFISSNHNKAKTCAQELPPVTKCDDGNGSAQGVDCVADARNDGKRTACNDGESVNE
jgi:hypothetical protein